MNTDSISDFIICLKNGSAVRKPAVTVGFSNLKMAVAEKLIVLGFIKGAVKKGKKTRKNLEIELAYKDNRPRITGVRRMSKSSHRLYLGARGIWPFRQGYGQVILTTSRGIMTGDEARAAKIGGEPLFKIW